MLVVHLISATRNINDLVPDSLILLPPKDGKLRLACWQVLCRAGGICFHREWNPGLSHDSRV